MTEQAENGSTREAHAVAAAASDAESNDSEAGRFEDLNGGGIDQVFSGDDNAVEFEDLAPHSEDAEADSVLQLASKLNISYSQDELVSRDAMLGLIVSQLFEYDYANLAQAVAQVAGVRDSSYFKRSNQLHAIAQLGHAIESRGTLPAAAQSNSEVGSTEAPLEPLPPPARSMLAPKRNVSVSSDQCAALC